MTACSSASSLIEGDRVSGNNAATLRGFLTVRDAASYLGLSPRTLYVWRHRRQGPPSFRMGPRGRVMYRLVSLDEWIAEQERSDSRCNTILSPLEQNPVRRVR
ncbi:helix-turn-helix transcriptional regulator [Streptomyces sp. NPDC058000]|uniref:helix-turn-helix transcriptional regulator n=1 Tax=Streptomyces sp. NPDC058000 TaxID=3346299 RepID=UPI0036E89D2A